MKSSHLVDNALSKSQIPPKKKKPISGMRKLSNW